MTYIVIGIDGGGTKTHAMVADEHGSPIAETVGPASAVRPGKAEESAKVIADVVRDALASCDMTHVTPRVLSVGVAGAGRETERHELWQALVSRDLAAELVIHSDFSIALDDAFADGPGVLLISGTGSVAFGRGPTGTTARCGGWGPVCGDEGSGAWIGRRALSVVTAAADGREPETALTGAILTAAQVNETSDLIGWASGGPGAARVAGASRAQRRRRGRFARQRHREPRRRGARAARARAGAATVRRRTGGAAHRAHRRHAVSRYDAPETT